MSLILIKVTKKLNELETAGSTEIQKIDTQKFRLQDQIKSLKDDLVNKISREDHESNLKNLQNDYERSNGLSQNEKFLINFFIVKILSY